MLYRLAAVPALGYSLLFTWQRGWLRVPEAEADAHLADGRALTCRLSDRTQRTMFLGLFEPEETRLVTRLLQPGDVFVDVGAHIGWFTTLAAAKVGSAGQVIACEPYPANKALLERNVRLNGSSNVHLVGAALGSSAGTLRIAMGPDSGSVTAVGWAHRNEADVVMTTLDDVVDASLAVTLLKIDVEGWEAHVLTGARQTLRHTRSVLFEVNPPALRKAGTSREELFDLLRAAGFTDFVTVRQGGLRRLRGGGITNVLATRR
jgi:FkbM family methyltransferase